MKVFQQEGRSGVVGRGVGFGGSRAQFMNGKSGEVEDCILQKTFRSQVTENNLLNKEREREKK